MKTPKSLLTHAAVFATGIGIAMIISRPDPADPASVGGEAAASRMQSARGGPLGATTDEAGRAGKVRAGVMMNARRFPGSSVEQLAEISKLGDPLERQEALYALLSRLGPDEFHEVAEQYRSLEHLSDSGGEFELILRMWAKNDPLKALEYTHGELGSRRRTGVVLSSWAITNPAAAEQWALDNHQGDGGNPYMAAVIRGVASQDMDRATELVQGMKGSRERGWAMDAITRALMVQGTDAAMAFPGQIDDESLRGGFVEMISRRLADDDPAQAADWLASMPEGSVQSRSAFRVGRELARADRKAAASWVNKLDPAAQAEAARGIIPEMSAEDIAGTARWVANLPTDMPNHDRVVESFVWSCDYRDPEQSAAWIQGVANENQRRKLYHRMLGGWAKRDAAAVKDWVSTNEVPEDVRRRFTR